MSSQGTFAVCNNRDISNDNEANICSTENNYSSSNFSVQSEIYNQKEIGRNKFKKNRQSRRTERLKNMRKNGNVKNVPKADRKCVV